MPIIDHIGIAVNSLEEQIPLYAAILGRSATGTEEIPDEQVRVAFFGEGAGRVELLEATDADSPVGRFLDRRGPGLHHVCLRVREIATAVERARAEGAELLPPGVRRGAGGRKVAFLHPRSAGGVLVELTERPDG